MVETIEKMLNWLERESSYLLLALALLGAACGSGEVVDELTTTSSTPTTTTSSSTTTSTTTTTVPPTTTTTRPTTTTTAPHPVLQTLAGVWRTEVRPGAWLDIHFTEQGRASLRNVQADGFEIATAVFTFEDDSVTVSLGHHQWPDCLTNTGVYGWELVNEDTLNFSRLDEHENCRFLVDVLTDDLWDRRE